ncbi:hypothetical protein Pmani_033253 [Petrolisthes manimaculis]|uniref:Uncharacterized protein n=1 Tax=Petrolisthes manimaculis TaxID=1843537 RepID=A0AAE1NQ43_9EUCA|nr:hypothetical protein Pmani_033253 [Petrolisthes manimaculis]
MVGVLQAAPPHQPRLHPQPRVNLTNTVNDALKDFLSTVEDPFPFKHRLTLVVGEPGGTFDLLLTMDNTTLAGIQDLRVTNAEGFPVSKDITVTINAPILTLQTPAYFINGSMVNHLEIEGEGPATLILENLDLILTGVVSDFTPSPLTMQLSEVALDLELWQWTVTFENMMPGTDLGTVFNEFFSMCGPELMDMWEIKINNEDKLLNFINGLLPQ